MRIHRCNLVQQIGQISRTITANFCQYLHRKQIRGFCHWMGGSILCPTTFFMRWGIKLSPYSLCLWKEKWYQMIKLMKSHVNIPLLWRMYYEVSNGIDDIWFPEMQTFEICKSLEAWGVEMQTTPDIKKVVLRSICEYSSITCILNNHSTPVKQWKI